MRNRIGQKRIRTVYNELAMQNVASSFPCRKMVEKTEFNEKSLFCRFLVYSRRGNCITFEVQVISL